MAHSSELGNPMLSRLRLFLTLAFAGAFGLRLVASPFDSMQNGDMQFWHNLGRQIYTESSSYHSERALNLVKQACQPLINLSQELADWKDCLPVIITI